MAASLRVVIGVDTHLDTVHLAVITDAGKPLSDKEFPTSPIGYDDALRWARSFGAITIAGVEGTSSYGAGIVKLVSCLVAAKIGGRDRCIVVVQGTPLPGRDHRPLRVALSPVPTELS